MTLRRSPIKSLPEGYHEVYYLSVTEPAKLARLNLLGLGLLIPFSILMIGWIIVARSWRGAYDVTDQIPSVFLWLGVLLALPLHEFIHGLAMQGVGHKPIYGAKRVRLGRIKLPAVLYATAGNVFFRRGEFIIIALAPMVVETLAGMAMIAFLPDYLAYYIALAVILNGSGSVGDVWMVAVVLRYPADTLIRDEADSIRIYVRDE